MPPLSTFSLFVLLTLSSVLSHTHGSRPPHMHIHTQPASAACGYTLSAHQQESALDSASAAAAGDDEHALPAAVGSRRLHTAADDEDAAPRTTPFDSSLAPSSSDLPPNDTRIVKKAPGCVEPEQVHLTLWTSTSVLVSWASCDAVLGQSTPVATDGVRSVVFYGSSRDALDSTAEGVSTSYAYDYNGTNGTSYASPLLQHVLLKGLTPGATYFYRVADTSGASSQEAGNAKLLQAHKWGRTFSFTLPKAATFPLQLGVIGDPGQTHNTTATLSRLMASNPQLMMLLGDFAYADNWLGQDKKVSKPEYGTVTFDPKWDTWCRLFEPLLSKVPLLHTNGNHELARQSNGDKHTAYNHRFPTPQHSSEAPTMFRPTSASAPFSNLYYSLQLPGMLTYISLTSYAPGQTFSTQEEQYVWLEAELQKIDRTQTPWLLVAIHAPFYHSAAGHFKEVECMRLTYEPLFVRYQVDIVFSGHVHAMERSHPVVDWQVDECGPVYLTVGDGGNVEGLYQDYVDNTRNGTAAVYCQDPAAYSTTIFPPYYQPQQCFTYQGGSFCPTQQPAWSAYREASFGFGTLELLSPTTARWTWRKNQLPAAWSVGDEVTLTRRGDSAKVCAGALAKAVQV